MVLRYSPPHIRDLPALGRQSLVDGDSPGGSTPPLGLLHLPSLPLATTLLAPDIARAGPQYPRALSRGRRGEREQPPKHGAYDARADGGDHASPTSPQRLAHAPVASRAAFSGARGTRPRHRHSHTSVVAFRAPRLAARKPARSHTGAPWNAACSVRCHGHRAPRPPGEPAARGRGWLSR